MFGFVALFCFDLVYVGYCCFVVLNFFLFVIVLCLVSLCLFDCFGFVDFLFDCVGCLGF